jgi:hypothetical protein
MAGPYPIDGVSCGIRDLDVGVDVAVALCAPVGAAFRWHAPSAAPCGW